MQPDKTGTAPIFRGHPAERHAEAHMADSRSSEDAFYLERLTIALRDAQPTSADICAGRRGSEQRRIEAVKELHAAYRALRRHGIKPMDGEPLVLFQVRQFFARRWDHALSANTTEEVVSAISSLFGERKVRGRKPVEDKRLEIARMVDDRVARGEPLSMAFEAVGGEVRPALSAKAVEDAYYGRGLPKVAKEQRRRKNRLHDKKL